MARPQKSGLDYFPFDVSIDQDDKIMLIESEFGIIGFAIIVKMLCKIYSNGYFYEWGEKEQLIFSKRINVDINQVNDCINSAIKWNLFDKTIYENHKVLTSKGIQKRYLEAVSRRKSIDIIEEYLLVDIAESQKNTINLINIDNNADINGINVDINPSSSGINDNISTQSKVKKSKENDIKENNIKEIKHKYGFYKNVLLTKTEYQKLLDQYGQSNLDNIIKYLDEYIEMKGYKAKSHYLVILKWSGKAALEEQAKENRNFFKDFLES